MGAWTSGRCPSGSHVTLSSASQTATPKTPTTSVGKAHRQRRAFDRAGLVWVCPLDQMPGFNSPSRAQ